MRIKFLGTGWVLSVSVRVLGPTGNLERVGTVSVLEPETTRVFTGDLPGIPWCKWRVKGGVRASSHRKLGFHARRDLEFHAAVRFQEFCFYRLLMRVDSNCIEGRKCS